MNAQAMMNKIKAGQLDDAFRRVYVTDGEVAKQKSRYIELLTTFAETFGGDREVHLMSAPGRTEICGNHTDHNHGKVLAAAINLDAIAVASKNEDGVVREGFKTPAQGASTSVWAAIGAELEGVGGLYLENLAEAVPFDPADPYQGVMPHALDPESAERLWALSEETTGVKL